MYIQTYVLFITRRRILTGQVTMLLLFVVRFPASIAKCGNLLLTQEGPAGMTLTECPGSMTGIPACPGYLLACLSLPTCLPSD